MAMTLGREWSVASTLRYGSSGSGGSMIWTGYVQRPSTPALGAGQAVTRTDGKGWEGSCDWRSVSAGACNQLRSSHIPYQCKPDSIGLSGNIYNALCSLTVVPERI